MVAGGGHPGGAPEEGAGGAEMDALGTKFCRPVGRFRP